MYSGGPPNSGTHPTRISVDSIRTDWRAVQLSGGGCCRALDSYRPGFLPNQLLGIGGCFCKVYITLVKTAVVRGRP